MKRTHSNGFTLIELAVTLVIAGILLTIAIPNFRDFMRSSSLISVTNQLVASIETSKGEALKRNMRAVIVPKDGAAWKNGWRVFVDANNDGVFDAADTLVQETEAVPDFLDFTVSDNSTAAGGTPYLMFDGSGFPRDASSGAFAANTLTIKRNDVATPNNTRRVIISATGRVRTCRPQSDPDQNCLPSASSTGN